MKKARLVTLCLTMFMFWLIARAHAQDDNKIYDFMYVEHLPTYPGGFKQLYNELGLLIKYPSKAAKNNVQGTVKLTFVVEKDGRLTDITTENKIGYGLDEEAVRIFKRLKKWAPGTLEGKPIRVRYFIPVKFSLE